MLGSIGGSEFLLIAALALLLFGPRKLPQLGRSLGRALAEFRGATREFKANLEREVEFEDRGPARSTGPERGGTQASVARRPIDGGGAGATGDARPAPRDGEALRSAVPPDDETAAQS